jgi:DNA (cytosine-5)-methyltransferase 1
MNDHPQIPVSPGPVIGSLCTGYGGLDLGVLAALGGGHIAWCADPDPHVAQILAARMPNVPNLGDITAINWHSVEPVEVLTAGFPCQDISAAGRRAGIENGTRSGLWTDIVAAVRVLRPALVFVENVAALRWKNGGIDRVLGDLAATGYDALWRSVRASDVGAAHRRERVFLLAWHRQLLAEPAADTNRPRRHVQRLQRTTPPGQPLLVGPASAPANTDRVEPERQGKPRQLAGPPATATGTGNQRQRYGNAIVHRGPAPADPDRVRREELHPRRAGRRPVTAPRGPAAPDTTRIGHRDNRPSRRCRISTAVVAEGVSARTHRDAPADTTGDGRHEGVTVSTRLKRRPNAPLRRDECRGSHQQRPAPIDWGDYTPAIRRWEQVLGRPTPHPTETGQHGRPVLAPTFVEHLMGLPPGWVTDLALPRTAQLRALGNGVIPLHAARVVTLLLDDFAALLDYDAAKAKNI